MRPTEKGRGFLPSRPIVSEAGPRPLLRRLAAQFAAAIAQGSEIRETPGYRIHLWPTPDPFYRNVAIPVAATDDPTRAVAEMVQVFAQSGRIPRLEFFAELWPDVPAVLEAAGFKLERRDVVMARPTAPPGLSAAAQPVQALDAGASRSALEAFLSGAAAAFGQEAAIFVPGEVDRLADGLRRGTIMAAVARHRGEHVAGASLVRVGEVAELVGVWCRPHWRRQGLARACCRHVLERFHADGGELAWLSAADEASAALYRGLGFAPCGTQLNYARPAVALT